jgi:hypothetical protein
MIRPSLAFCLILFCPILKAQQDTTLSKLIPSHAYTIVFSESLALLDVWNGMSARLGVEHAWNNKFSVYGTGGVYFERGYMFRVGAKKFISKRDNNRYYLGIDYMHNWHIHTEQDYYRKPDVREGYAPDDSRPFSFTEEKNMHVLDLTFGIDQFWRYGWAFQFYAGAGVKWRKALISAPDSTLDQLYHYHESMIENVSAQPGNGLLLDVRWGIRIGRVFAARRRQEY